jgi:oxygen-independent coproporphyrinogen-3 oxidase
VYVHFPYCAVKCPYCDFNSHVVSHDDVRYADALLRELETRGADLAAPPGGLASIYFGGGTPSRWDPGQVARVVRALEGRYGLAEGAEVTLEANPGTVAEGRLEAFRAAGVNRFSIGCQSFDDDELRSLGRIHSAEASVRAARMAKATGARISLDLIYGLPGQTEARALASVDAALALEPDHLSAYTLTIEPETVLARRVRLGLFKPMPDDEQAARIERVSAHLAEAGFDRYEVSSYAREGRVSVHNTLYWLGGAYLGLGAGAHGYLPGPGLERAVRRENVKIPERYVETALAGRTEARFEEQLERAQVVSDRLMVVFRTAFGLDVDALDAELGGRLERATLLPLLETLHRQGFLVRAGARWRPTTRGFLFNDAIARAMVHAGGLVAPEGRPGSAGPA